MFTEATHWSPAILQSSDGGASFIIRFCSQFDSQMLRTGITDVIFPEDRTTGYAVDADRILRTTNGGLSWYTMRVDPGSYFNRLQAVDNNTVFALCNDYMHNKILRSTDAGLTWSNLPLPVSAATKVLSVFFLNASTGWLNMMDNNNNYYMFRTTNGAVSWTLLNNITATPISSDRLKFIDANTGYAISNQYNYTIYKTLNGGALWEPLPRDNNYAYLNNSHYDLQVLSANQLWAGGGHGFLEMSNNGGGTPLPKAYFLKDTTGVAATGIVHMTNYSRTDYTYKWFVNNTQINTTYNCTYNHVLNSYLDSIKLVVNNGTRTDTLIQYQYFNVPAPPVPTISSFTPTYGQTGSVINITGTNFTGGSAVRFGGTRAVSFTVNSATSISAVLDSAASGNVDVVTPYGTGTRAGFSSLTPLITSFSPTSGGTGTVITVNGANLTSGGPYTLKFGGVTATNFTFSSSTSLNGTVGAGANGNITFQTAYGTATIGGFTFIPPPHISSFTPLSSDQGGTVTISGTNLTGTTSVKFGGTAAASFIVNSPNTVTAVVGPGASGKVYLANPYGADSLAGFVYTTPVITSFGPTVGGTGSVIQITGTDFTGINTVSFGGTPAASFTVNSPTSITSVVSMGSGGSVRISGPHGAASKAGFVFNNTIPVIGSFSPRTGAAGSTVQIFGSGFNATAANNVVYFGSVKAVVSAATPSVLDVIVPAFAGYQNIMVNVNGYTAISPVAFDISFPDGTLTAGTFGASLELTTKKHPRDIIVTDIDGDGKADIVIKSDDTLSVFRNTGTGGALSFDTRVDIYIQGIAGEFKAADINGDGTPDIVMSKSSVLCVLPNNSTPGNISFGTLVNTGVACNPRGLAVDDLTGDGKPDVAFVTTGLYACQNTSSGGSISFSAPVLFSTSANTTYAVTTGDFDGDGKEDIAVCNTYITGSSQTQAASIFRNTNTANNLSFAGAAGFGPPGWYTDIHVADFNGDGKTGLVFGVVGWYDGPSNTLTQTYKGIVLQNKSTPGSMSFDTQIFNARPTSDQAWGITVGDLNGDGKPDVVSINNDLAVMQNTYVPNTVSFGSPIGFSTGTTPSFKIVVADLNGDSKPEIVVCKLNLDRLAIYINNDPSVFTHICTGGSGTISSNISSSSYQWQVNTGSGFTNISDNTYYSGTATHDLALSNIPAGYAAYQYKCVSGSGISNTFVLAVDTVSTAAVSINASAAATCDGSPVVFTAMPVNAGTAPSYQWLVNNINAGTNSNIFTSNTLHANDSVKVIMTVPAACGSQQTVTSNAIAVQNVTNIWTGAADNSWENPANWSCNVVPDAQTNVIIPSGTCIVSSIAVCWSLTVMPGATFRVNPGYTITIMH